MAVTTVHAQLIRYTDSGNQIIVNLKTTGDDISISRSSNGNVPSSVTTLQGLTNSLGALAFKNTIADATTSASGLMTGAMVSKLNGIASGANAYSHPNSGVTSGTYRSVTVNAQGHVTAGSNPTTLAGYGITDAAYSSHSHYSLRTIADNRGINTKPNDYNGVIVFSGLKGSSSINSPSADIYSYVVGLRGWSDSSGGDAHEFAFNNTGVFRRVGETTAWANWLKMLDSGNYTGYTVTKTGGGASGTWEINITGSAGSVAWGNVSGKPSSMPASDVYAWAKASAKPSYSWSEISGKPSTFPPSSHSHSEVIGSYTGNGGQQKPNYFGTNKVGFLMMNTTVNGDYNYKDWIIMDCYGGNDVGGSVAFGVNRQKLGAYIMRSAAERKEWAESAELLSTANYTGYVPTKTGSGASGTWGINITGKSASADKLNNMDFLKVQAATPTESCIWCKIDA